LEIFHKTIRTESILSGVPLSLDYACRIVEKYIEHFSTVRMESVLAASFRQANPEAESWKYSESGTDF